MTTVEVPEVVLKLFKDLGLEPQEGIVLSIKLYIENMIGKYEEKVRLLEKKHGCNYHEFKGKFNIKSHHSWEEEADLFDWGAALTEIKALKEILKDLRD